MRTENIIIILFFFLKTMSEYEISLASPGLLKIALINFIFLQNQVAVESEESVSLLPGSLIIPVSIKKEVT